MQLRGLGGAAAHAGGKLGSLEIAHYAHGVFVQMLGTALSNPLLPSDVAAMDSTLAPEMAPMPPIPPPPLSRPPRISWGRGSDDLG